MDDCDQLKSGELVVPADWDPVQAASAQSAFVAVLAGFVFIGMVYILTQGHRRHSGATLMLFMASFLCLAAGSYITTLVSGEITCLRAWSESMFASGLVAVGSVAMLCGLVWLLPDRHGSDKMTRNFMLSCTLLIAIVVIQLLTTTARGYLLDLPIADEWRDRATWYFLAGPLIVIGWLSRHIPRRQAKQLKESQRRRVAAAAFSVFTFALVSLFVLGLIGDRPADLWTSPATWVIATSTLVPMVGAAVAIFAVVAALPTAQTWTTGELSPVTSHTSKTETPAAPPPRTAPEPEERSQQDAS